MSSGYGTNVIAPALPVVMGHNRTFLALFGLAVNTEFNYPRYFSMVPIGGPKPKEAFARGFLGLAMAQDPKPTTLAIVGADAEFPHNAMDGARVVAKEIGLKVVYDKTYPPTTTDYSPDRTRDPGDQSGYHPGHLVPAGYRRHDPGRQRGRPESEAIWRRHGRAAEHFDQRCSLVR